MRRSYEKDRHVLAAVVRANANQLVTLNGRDFPIASVMPDDIEVVSPDTLLINVWRLFENDVMHLLETQATQLRNGSHDVATIIERLSTIAPDFAKLIGNARKD